MKIFSKHRRKMEPRRRFGGLEFRNKIKTASNYKRAFNPGGGSSFGFLPSGGLYVRALKVLGVVTVIIGIYFFLVSPSLQVTEITIQGNRQVTTEQIETVLDANGNSRLFLIKKNNFFLMSKGRVNDLLTQSLPTIKEVIQYDRVWPNKAKIEIVEHTPGFVIKSSGSYFLIDDEGVVVEQIEDPKKLLVAEDQLMESFERGENLPNTKLAPFILSMNKSWNTKITTPIASVKFPGKSSNEIHFITEQGWTVLFDTTRAVSLQLTDLAVILSKQIKPADLPKLAYIDLRLSKWVYYCFKESPCQQQEKPDAAAATTNNE